VIVVDTSVWIDVLNGQASPAAERFEALLEDDAPLGLTDVVYTEVLQGLRSEREAALVASHLDGFPILRLEGLSDFALAAQLYRTARRAGVTVRKTLDCLIAAPCVRTGSRLLHRDADFDRLATCTSLAVVSV
jgi:predicted nucleic acid-binding protein